MALAPGSAVHVGDVLVTGPEARLAVRFTDGTLLTLGADTTITVDEYVYCADGSLVLDMAGGVFRIISGELARLNPDKFTRPDPPGRHRHSGHGFLGRIPGGPENWTCCSSRARP